jgi:hypothetical protein
MDSVKVDETRTNSPVDLSSFMRTAQPIVWAGPAGDVLIAVRRVRSPAPRPGEQRRPTVIKPSDIRPQRYLLYRLSDGRVLAEDQGFLHEPAGPAERRLIRQGECTMYPGAGAVSSGRSPQVPTANTSSGKNVSQDGAPT